jgi:hypothetical protein
MAFGELSNPIEPEDDEFLPNDWFEESKTTPPQENWIIEPEAALLTKEEKEVSPPFKEVRALPEYSIYADAQY